MTLRAIVLGGALTFVFAAANVYFGLRVGLTFSTAIPAAVISMALLRSMGGSTIVENNIVQTIGSAAGAVATMIFVLPGLIIIGWWQDFPYWTTMLVCALGGTLGVLLSVPLRRALVIDSPLPYPEGVAGAEILKVGMADDRGAKENQAGLATIIMGSLVAAGYGVMTAIGTAAAEVGRNFKLGAGVTGLGATMSLGLIGVGHLVGLATGLAMLVGVVIGRGALLPWLSAGEAGPIDEVVAAVFSQQVRMVGAGAIAVAALWALVRIAGSIARGLSGIAAASRARKAGEELALAERDLPGSIVIGGSLALLVPILFLLWQFVQGGPLADQFGLAAVLAVAFIAVVGIVVAVVTGYMAGLIGTSNSPVSGVGILAILVASVVVAAVFGGGVAPADRAPLIAFALFVTAFVFGIALISNDNLQDLKTGQLVGSTPWKQQVSLVIGVVAGAMVIPPVLNLINSTFGFAGAPGAGAMALAAPQASLIASIAQGVLGGSLRWDLIGLGAGLGAVLIVIDEALSRSGKRLPPLAVAMGIYLPASVMLPTILGAVIGWRWDKMAEQSARPEFLKRMGVLLATGLVVGDSLFGLVYAGTVAAVEDPARLSLVGPGFVPIAEFTGIVLLAGGLVYAYRRTKAKALAAF
jgi:putative OPT family oligopeptide transporter